ncbi:MAG TPA: DUF1990 domain-containing protein [Candidatus Acidoferrales bacterium]|nr:DUF1990 domain-containing protein [Candidatus Acidoferrales bacterium]
MFFLSKPSRESIGAFISGQRDKPFSYPHVGASRESAPSTYAVDHHRVQLGQGDVVFARAVKAVTQWRMFDMPWIHLCWPDAPIQTGATVAVLVSHLGFWSLNACRVVYVIEEHGMREKYGFAYGTLPQHGEIGEERFTVEFQSDDQSVWYDIYALSRPGPVAKLGYPYARILQKRFARDSIRSMMKVVNEASP